MITKDLLYAIFQGLPANFLDHLPDPWPRLARLIGSSILSTPDPVSAFRAALLKLSRNELYYLRRSLRAVLPVMQLAGLSYRQREALIALRTQNTATLTKLSQMTSQDRSNLHRRLGALVKKGLVIKFFRPGGVHYFAVQDGFGKDDKLAVDQFFDDLILEAQQPLARTDANGRPYTAEFHIPELREAEQTEAEAVAQQQLQTEQNKVGAVAKQLQTERSSVQHLPN